MLQPGFAILGELVNIVYKIETVHFVFAVRFAFADRQGGGKPTIKPW
jgi:hypothetical protein